jgi:hypothetical protein
VGVYARETPLSCQTTMATYQTGRGRTQTITTGTSCSAMDSYPWKMMTTVNGESVDIIPMPLLHFTTALYKDSDVEIDFKFMGNFVLNEFGFAVPF